ncbi:tyrosine-type recombinase/integrase [Leptospira kirschneri]|uniref:Site-specific tyrosine recombinase XerC n=1 Tax=Leptospira kirschneri str. 200802841 TaxID=1193047 RepID=A0A828Y8U8_9LEPT|nr:tyrosine-type recombinase/integrase [Leptospira kirschneri]EKO53929.1 putative site-specific tyrosine recombinase XerC [Leptospira kirschneri str. 200802841]
MSESKRDKREKIPKGQHHLHRLTTKPTPSILEVYILEHLQTMYASRYSNGTIQHRRFGLLLLLDWCEERGIESPLELTRSLMDRFQRYVGQYRNRNTGKPVAINTLSGMLVNVRMFFLWLERREYIPKNPALDLKIVSTGRRLPRNILKVEEAEKILSVPDLETPYGIRDRVILELFYSTGIRCFELQKLILADIDFTNRTVFIREGKRRQDRMIPISSRALEWLRKYVEDVRPGLVSLPDEGYIFLTNKGKALHTSQIIAMTTKYREQSGVMKQGSTHMFRHTTATLMLDNGADIRYIQEMLGHRRLNSTQIYTHVAIGKLKEVYDRTHPAEQDQTNKKDSNTS